MKVCVCGLGQVGLPTAKYIKDMGIETWGYDISPDAITKAEEYGIKSRLKFTDIPKADIYIICVLTSIRNNEADFSPVYEVCTLISKISDKNTLVSIESTISSGVSKDLYTNIFHKQAKLVHVPHRYWAGDEINYGVRQLRVIGSINQPSLKKGLEFYKKLGIPLHQTSSIEIAEISKIIENTHRYLQIAFAEELRMICEELGLSFNEVKDACNTKWNVEILEAREGIGGHCLPKDIEYLSNLTQYNDLLKSAVNVDKNYRKWVKKNN